MTHKLRNKFAIFVLVAIMMGLMLQAPPTSTADSGNFDLATGNAADVIIPTIIPHIFQNVSPSGGDAPLVFRYTMLVTNAWFDAAAPYHPTAIGVYSDLGRQPAYDGRDNTNLNMAIFYATYRVLLSLAPEQEMTWRGMLASVGLDPDDDPVTAWGGPGEGTVNDLPASQWTSYMPVANHPEYPSASASFCAAHAEVARRYLGTDQLNWAIPVKAADDPTLMPPMDVVSVIEPGVTPQQALVLEFPTWTEFEETCGISRLWGGVHFYASIPAGQDIGHQVADVAYNYFESLLDGTAR